MILPSKSRQAIVEIPTRLPCQYLIREVQDAQGLVILLHGYLQSGSYIFSKLEPQVPPEYAVLAMNAPFPLPGKGEGHHRLGYTWYFYSAHRDEYLVGREPAISYISNLVEKLGVQDLPKVIVGYSQGGYLAPFVAARLGEVRRVIGVACEYLVEEIAEEVKAPLSFRVEGLHGAEDDVVSPAAARSSFERLLETGVHGEFHLVPGVQHKITPPLQEKLGQLLAADE